MNSGPSYKTHWPTQATTNPRNQPSNAMRDGTSTPYAHLSSVKYETTKNPLRRVSMAAYP